MNSQQTTTGAYTESADPYLSFSYPSTVPGASVGDNIWEGISARSISGVTHNYSTMSPFTADSRYIITGADSGYLRTPPSDTFSGSGRKDSKGNTSDPMMRSSPSQGQRHDRYDRREERRIDEPLASVRGATEGLHGPPRVCRPQTPERHSPRTSPRHQPPDDER